MRRQNGTVLLLSLLGLGLGACTKTSDQNSKIETPTSKIKKNAKSSNKKTPQKSHLVIYSGRSAKHIEPLLKQFEKESGIAVKTRFDKSTQTLANRIASEGQQTEADVFFAQDSGYLGALARAGLLTPISKELIKSVPAQFRHKDRLWTGTSGRARVLVYNPDRVKPEDLPKSLTELTDPKWKGRIGWAPSNASLQAHVSALRKIWGEEKTTEWLKGIQANKPVVYPKNSPQVRAVSKGEIDVGWVNHYYLHKLKAADPSLKAANHSFSTKGDAGNLMMVSGIAIPKASKNREAAEKLIAFILSKTGQSYFAQKIYEYPVRGDIPRHKNIPAITDQLVTVEQEALADVAGTMKRLRELGIQ